MRLIYTGLGLFAPATSVNRNIDVRGIEISRDGGATWLQENITISNRERALRERALINRSCRGVIYGIAD